MIMYLNYMHCITITSLSYLALNIAIVYFYTLADELTTLGRREIY